MVTQACGQGVPWSTGLQREPWHHAGSTPLGARFFVKQASGKSSPGQAEAQTLPRELWLGVHIGAELY